MYKFIWLVAIILVVTIGCGANQENGQNAAAPSAAGSGQPAHGSPVYEEIIVESNLNIRKKQPQPARRARSVVFVIPGEEGALAFAPHSRQKRQWPQQYQQPQFPHYGGSASQANANANAFRQNPDGVDTSNAGAQAQGFSQDSPFGTFGSNAANAHSNSLHFGADGFRGNAGHSGAYNFDLPGTENDFMFVYSDTVNFGSDGKPSRAHSHALNRGG